jgi:hypothetical protein
VLRLLLWPSAFDLDLVIVVIAMMPGVWFVAAQLNTTQEVASHRSRRGYEPGEFADGSPPLKILSLIAWVVGIVVYFALVGVSLAGASIVPQVLASPIGASLPSFAVAAGVHVLASRLAAPAAGRAPA